MSNNETLSGQQLSTKSKIKLTAQYKALYPRRYTKAMITTLISSGVIVIGLQVLLASFICIQAQWTKFIRITVRCPLFLVYLFEYKSFIYYNFTQEYDANSLPSQNYGVAWADFYTAMIMSSASANALVGLFLMCVLRAGRRFL